MTSTATRDTDTLLDRARAAIDTTHLEQVLDDVARRIAAARAVQRLPAEVARSIAADVVAGQPVPDDLRAQLVAVRRTNEEAGAEIEALRVVQDRVRNALQRRRQSGADRAIAVLADELAAIVDAARPVLETLGDVSDAAAAIDRARPQAWREAVELAARHDELREAQRIITTSALAPDEHLPDRIDPAVMLLVDVLGHVRHPERWTDVALHIGVGEAVLGGGRDPRLEPGLVEGTLHMPPALAERSTMAPWLTDNPVERLRFIARPDVEPWAPTPHQLREVRSQVEAWRPGGDEEATANPADEAAYRQRVHFAARAHQVSG